MDYAQIFIYAVFIFVGLAAIYYGVRWLVSGRKKVGKKDNKAGDKVRVWEYNNINADMGWEYYEQSLIDAINEKCGGLGREWDDDGIPAYSIIKFKEATSGFADGFSYCPAEWRFDMTRTHSPYDVHEAIYQPEIKRPYNGSVSASTMQRYGHLIMPGLAIAFIMFLMVSG